MVGTMDIICDDCNRKIGIMIQTTCLEGWAVCPYCQVERLKKNQSLDIRKYNLAVQGEK